jgi:D-glycero-alpha-D-manno-heptose-7-phosphate kinase
LIITRTPFRITLGGGGTDLPSFYEQHGGFVFTMSINKYMYIMLHRLPVTERKSIIRYSEVEYVSSYEEISHPLAREVLKLHDVREYIELTSMADMPAKTGLGSSGAYLVGMLAAVRAYQKKSFLPEEIAREACHIEMDILKEPVGKQDQYIAAFGGFRTLDISRSGDVKVDAVAIDFTSAVELVQKARIYYTGFQRSATAVLSDQNEASKKKDHVNHAHVIDSLCHIKELGYRTKKAFAEGDLDAFGLLMDEHWQYKKRMSKNISLSVVDELYERTRKDYGVLGGKVIGAGGGGFIMLYCPTMGRALDSFMLSQDMPRVNYFPSMKGVTVVSDMSALDDFDTQTD